VSLALGRSALLFVEMLSVFYEDDSVPA